MAVPQYSRTSRLQGTVHSGQWNHRSDLHILKMRGLTQYFAEHETPTIFIETWGCLILGALPANLRHPGVRLNLTEQKKIK